MLAPGRTRAPRVSRAAHRETRQSCSSVARQSRTGLLDEVDGVPLALDRARLFLSGCRNCNLDDILTSALLAHPARAFDHNIGRIAVDIEPANLVEIQGSDFTGRAAKASRPLNTQSSRPSCTRTLSVR